MKTKNHFFSVLCIGLLSTASGFAAESISVNFSGDGTADYSITGETAVGIEPVAGAVWMNLTGNDSRLAAPQVLTDSLGATTTARITYAAPVYGTSLASAPGLRRGYLGDADGNAPAISVTDVPYAAYDVILYFSADSADGQFASPLINGVYYTCGSDGIGSASASGGVWGDTNANTAPELGANAIRINGLSSKVYPTLQIRGSTVEGGRGTIAGFQIVEAGSSAMTVPQSLCFNFTHGANSVVAKPQGVVTAPVFGWNNPAAVSAGSGTQASLILSDGQYSNASITWSSSGPWSSNASEGTILKGYLDDGGTGATIAFSNIPFTSYDAYVIIATDNNNGFFRSVVINGTAYTFNNYQTVAGSDNFVFAQNAFDASLIEGKNYLVLRGLTGAGLSIQGSVKSDSYRGPIAAVQIVNRGDPVTGWSTLFTRSLAANSNWHASEWNSLSGASNLPWTDDSSAVITNGASKLTLTQPATAREIVFNGSGTLLDSSTPENALEVAKITVAPSDAGAAPTLAAALNAKDGGDLKLYSHGQTSGTLNNGGLTHFKPLTLDAASLRICSGLLSAETITNHGVPLILDGGGLFDINKGVKFEQPLQIGAKGGIYRVWSTPKAVITGCISTETGVSKAGDFVHIDTGNLVIAGDVSRFNGTFRNATTSVGCGELILTNTTVTAAGNNIELLNVSGVKNVFYDVPAGQSATYNGTFTPRFAEPVGAALTAAFIKRGAGTLTLAGQSTSVRAPLEIVGGTLIMGANSFGGADNRQSTNEWLRITGGATLLLKKDWNYGATFAFGQLGHGAKMRVNGGTLRFETDSATVEGGSSSNNNSRGFYIGANGATIDVAAGYTYTKRKTSQYSGEYIRFAAPGASLTLTGQGTGIIHDDIPNKGTAEPEYNLLDGSVRITGANWAMNGAYTYTGGTTVATGAMLKGTGTFSGSPVTVAGTIETGSTIGTLNLNANAKITVAFGKVITVTEAINMPSAVTVQLAAAPAIGAPVPVMLLPEGATIDAYAFSVTGFEDSAKYRVFQNGRNVVVARLVGTRVMLF